jgi:hypothetical protein
MARLLTTGAEEADVSSMWDRLNFRLNSNPFYPIWRGPTNETLILPRTGSGMYGLYSEDYMGNNWGLSTSHTELYYGFALRLPILNGINFLTMWTSDPNVFNYRGRVSVNSSGQVQAIRQDTVIASSSAGVVSVSTWHYYEVWYKPLNSNGRFVIYVDGTKVVDFTGDTTDNKEYINGWDFIGVEKPDTGRAPILLDDIVLNDQNGSVNNSYPGMVRLLPIHAVSAGTNAQWARAGVDMGSDAAQVRNGQFEFAMLQTASADQKVDFVTEVPDLPTGAVIKNIVVGARARVQNGSGVIAPMVIANGTESVSADQTLASAWRNYQYAWAVNPEDSAAWEEGDLANLKIGVSS